MAHGQKQMPKARSEKEWVPDMGDMLAFVQLKELLRKMVLLTRDDGYVGFDYRPGTLSNIDPC